MSFDAVRSTGRSLSFYLRMQEVTANNIANANTDMFKAIRISARNLPGATYPAPVEVADLQQGTLRETGRPLDLSLEGPGFFVIQTENGERLIRGGPFNLDTAGHLSDSNGDIVLGVNGPIVLNGTRVEIQDDGTVNVDGTQAGRLRIETVDDPSTMLKEERGRFVPQGPTRPMKENETYVRQGLLEEANLDPIHSLVDLITIQRAYAANIDALKAMDSVLGTVTRDVGRV